MKSNRDRQRQASSFIYAEPPRQDPRRYEIIKYATWRMRLYQELQSMSFEELQKKSGQTIDKMFPKLCVTKEQQQFYMDFIKEMSDTHEQEVISHFICLMLYSRDLKNHDTFVKMQRMILSMKLDWIKKGPQKMFILKYLIHRLTKLPMESLNLSKQEYESNQLRITRWYDRAKNDPINETWYLKVPFEFGQPGLRKRKCYVQKGFIYSDIQTASDIVVNLYCNYLRERLHKTRSQTQKLLENDVENQLKPFMDKAINSVSTTTIQQSSLNSQFKLNLKNIEGVWKKFFPPCMFHLNKKLKQNNHLKHEGRRQLWLFFKGCGMDVNDNKAYFHKYLGLKVSNSDLKSHMYNIEHAYGLVGKKQEQRPKTCTGIIVGVNPKKDEHHGCPFKHWSKETLADFLHHNYNLKENQMRQILERKQNNEFQVACGRLFEYNFKPQGTELPQQITGQLGKSPHQYFVAGMESTEWINTKTLRRTKTKPLKNTKMELQF